MAVSGGTSGGGTSGGGEAQPLPGAGEIGQRVRVRAVVFQTETRFAAAPQHVMVRALLRRLFLYKSRSIGSGDKRTKYKIGVVLCNNTDVCVCVFRLARSVQYRHHAAVCRAST